MQLWAVGRIYGELDEQEFGAVRKKGKVWQIKDSRWEISAIWHPYNDDNIVAWSVCALSELVDKYYLFSWSVGIFCHQDHASFPSRMCLEWQTDGQADRIDFFPILGWAGKKESSLVDYDIFFDEGIDPFLRGVSNDIY